MPVQKTSHPSPPTQTASRSPTKTEMLAYARPLSRAAVLGRLVGRLVQQIRSIRDRLVQRLAPSRQSDVPTAQDFRRSQTPTAESSGSLRVHPQPQSQLPQDSADYATEASKLIETELSEMGASPQKLIALTLPGEAERPGYAFAEQMWKDANRSKYSGGDGDNKAVLFQMGDSAGFGGTTVPIEQQKRAREAIQAFANATTGGDLARLNAIARYAQQGLVAGLMKASMLPGAPLTLEQQQVTPITLSGDTEFFITREASGSHLVRVTLSPTAEPLIVSRGADGELLALPKGSTIRAEMTIRVNLDGTAELVDPPKTSMSVGGGKVMTMSEYTDQAKSTVLKVR